MEMYFASCRKNTANKNSSVRRTNKIRLMLVSNWAVCHKENQGSLKVKKLVD